MAKRNSGTSSSGRRGSSRRNSEGGSFSQKGKSSGRSFKATGRRDHDRPLKSNDPRRKTIDVGAGRDSDAPRKSGRRKDQTSAGKRSFKSGARPENGPSFKRPNKKFSGKKDDYSDREGVKGPRRRTTGAEFKGVSGKGRETQPGKKYPSRNVQPDIAAPVQTEKMRLNRYIANSGICSRREADELIRMGLVTVNGKAVTEMGFKVNPGDEVRYENRVLHAEKPVYILMNKPKGYLTTTDDPKERNTVMHLLRGAVKERVYPVGRLDRNTTGLLLLTNDGDLADKLMHPSYNVRKIYKVELDRPLSKADFQKITEGVQLEEGRAMVDDLAIISEDGKTVGMELHIGWNRVVRRIFEAFNYEVIRLDRSVYAGLDKKDLGRGEWRFLRKDEIVHLKHFK